MGDIIRILKGLLYRDPFPQFPSKHQGVILVRGRAYGDEGCGFRIWGLGSRV